MMHISKINLLKISAWSGLVGSALFVLTFTLEGIFRPGYDPYKMFISALSLGSNGWIQITNFIVLGVFLLIFSRAVASEFPTGKASRGGIILLTILGILYLISGPFVMDPTGTPAGQMTVHGTIHGLAGGFVFLLMPITIIVYLRRFLDDPKWVVMRNWTIILAIIESSGVLFFTIVSKLPEGQNTFTNWLGLIQRLALIPFMVWIFIFAFYLLVKVKVEAARAPSSAC